jgi:two-component system chemotaxis sensor kinase CheA
MEDLINEFIAETREMLEALGGEIVAWEAAPNERGRLDEIFRFVHTVKGNCGFFDLPRLEALSHAAEGALVEVRSGRRTADHDLVSAVLAIIDRIGELIDALETGEAVASADDRHLIEALAESEVHAAPVQSAPAGSATEQRKAMRSIRLSVDLLDKMMSGVSDLVLARNELSRRLRDGPQDPAIEAAFDQVSASIGEIRDAITRSRMQRVENLFVALPRMVRDLSADLGKQVMLELEGQDVELDREMIEMMRDPLTHIVRNAIDHGIEAPEQRIKAGKPPVGRLRVSASQSGNQILIEISDDGRGIDGAKLARNALAAGIITQSQAERLSDAQQSALVFEPGLSTAGEVTAISGRGVGMDVVRANIERIGGLIEIENRQGQGLRLIVRVPLTLTIIAALTVGACGQTYAIPRAAIDEIVRGKGNEVRIDNVGGGRVVRIRDRLMPLISLDAVLGLEEESSTLDRILVVLKPAGGDAYALAVDAVHDHEELVIKPAAPAVMAVGLYAGTTLADDGKPVLLLDPCGIAASASIPAVQSAAQKLEAEPDEAAVERLGTPALLFRTRSGIKRAIALAVIERIEDVPAEAVRLSAGSMRAAVDDSILPLAGCTDHGGARLRILRLSDGASRLAYGFGDVIDLVTLNGEISAAAVPGEIGGVTLIEGEQVEVIDPFWLFANHASGAEKASSVPVCAIPSNDVWMNNILRPIIEAAGYKVVAPGEGPAPDILIASAETAAEPRGTAAEIIRIRSKPERASEDDDSIYRYDRAALISALARRKGGRS